MCKMHEPVRQIGNHCCPVGMARGDCDDLIMGEEEETEKHLMSELIEKKEKL